LRPLDRSLLGQAERLIEILNLINRFLKALQPGKQILGFVAVLPLLGASVMVTLHLLDRLAEKYVRPLDHCAPARMARNGRKGRQSPGLLLGATGSGLPMPKPLLSCRNLCALFLR
jgi:hypothetical protein